MTTSSASGTSAPNPLATLEAEELAVVLKPVFSLLTNLQQPGANIETAVTGIPVVELQEASNLPVIETLGINNVAAVFQAKLAAWQASLSSGSGAA
jgi:hypothetical protein